MKMDGQQVGTVEILTPIGAMVDEAAQDFAQALLARLKSANPRVVLAMHEVPYLDSVALEGLVDAADALSARAARLKLVHVNATCREVMELTGVSERFIFFEDVQDAVRSFL
ncbi:MAG: STAS domain-containing protein [Phycisphaerae bacterium]